MDYSIRFIGHVDKARREEGWPEKIECSSVLRADHMQQVFEYLGAIGTKIKMENGLWSTTALPGGEKSDVAFGTGVFVPMHMFTHVSFSARALAGEVPDENNKGVIN